MDVLFKSKFRIYLSQVPYTHNHNQQRRVLTDWIENENKRTLLDIHFVFGHRKRTCPTYEKYKYYEKTHWLKSECRFFLFQKKKKLKRIKSHFSVSVKTQLSIIMALKKQSWYEIITCKVISITDIYAFTYIIHTYLHVCVQLCPFEVPRNIFNQLSLLRFEELNR